MQSNIISIRLTANATAIVPLWDLACVEVGLAGTVGGLVEEDVGTVDAEDCAGGAGSTLRDASFPVTRRDNRVSGVVVLLL